MSLLKITENHYIDVQIVAEAIRSTASGLPQVEICYKDEERVSTIFRGDEALEAWRNWTAHHKGRDAEEHEDVRE